jgi:hypothetical protein
MRRSTLKHAAAAALLLHTATAPAWAHEPAKAAQWQVSLGAFVPINLPAGTNSGTGVTLALEGSIWRKGAEEWLVGLRHSTYQPFTGSTVALTSPTAEYRRHFGSVYFGVAAGAVFGVNTIGGSSATFAHNFAAGVQFRQLFAEARWIRGTRTGEEGIALSGGWRF